MMINEQLESDRHALSAMIIIKASVTGFVKNWGVTDIKYEKLRCSVYSSTTQPMFWQIDKICKIIPLFALLETAVSR